MCDICPAIVANAAPLVHDAALLCQQAFAYLFPKRTTVYRYPEDFNGELRNLAAIWSNAPAPQGSGYASQVVSRILAPTHR